MRFNFITAEEKDMKINDLIGIMNYARLEGEEFRAQELLDLILDKTLENRVKHTIIERML